VFKTANWKKEKDIFCLSCIEESAKKRKVGGLILKGLRDFRKVSTIKRFL
jgi:hypothetical protein